MVPNKITYFGAFIPLISQEFLTHNTTIISLESRNKTAKRLSHHNPAAGQRRTGDLARNGTVVTATLRCREFEACSWVTSTDVQLHVCLLTYSMEQSPS